MAHFFWGFSFPTVVFLAILGVAMGYGDDGCREVYNNFNWCEPFLEGSSYDVPYECCNGLAMLNQMSKTEYGGAARICQCIENVAASGSASASGSHLPFSESRITDLYYRCNIHLSFPISEHMDCSRIIN